MKIYSVGGAVRDKLLGLTPKDYDWVIVGAETPDVQKLLDDGYSQVGADFPVFLHPTTGEEYALARIERKVDVGYHGFTVSAGPEVTLEEDLSRRDITINSMAMDEYGNIIDPYGGQHDIANKILRHTSPAFNEDPLRILRLARFAARLEGWTIAPATIVMCRALASSGALNELSSERIWTELKKGIVAGNIAVFVETLNILGAIEHCNVLSLMFHTVPSFATIDKYSSNLTKYDDEDKTFTVAIAVMVKICNGFIPLFNGCSSRIAKCEELLSSVMPSGYKNSALSVYALLCKARAFSQGETFGDFCESVRVMELADARSVGINYDFLQAVYHRVRDITAADFPDVVGQELGKAIAAARVNAISTMLTYWS